MAQELQGLLDRIHKEGIKKAESEKAALIDDAKKQADSIIKKANAEADSIIKKAGEDARKNEERAKATIQQAARDILILLESELNRRLNLCVSNLTAEAMTPAAMIDIINQMAVAYSKQLDKDLKLELIFSPNDLDTMTNQLRAVLAKNLKEEPEFFKGHDITCGVKIGFKGKDVFFDFSGDALTEIICEYAGPRLASILRGDNQ